MRVIRRAVLVSIGGSLRRGPARSRRRNTIRCERHRDQDRQHHAVQRAGLGLWHDRQGAGRLLPHDQRAGRHQRPQDHFISYDDAYSPPKTVEQARKLVESDEVLLIFHRSAPRRTRRSRNT
jgi:hypothetical protein